MTAFCLCFYVINQQVMLDGIITLKDIHYVAYTKKRNTKEQNLATNFWFNFLHFIFFVLSWTIHFVWGCTNSSKERKNLQKSCNCWLDLSNQMSMSKQHQATIIIILSSHKKNILNEPVIAWYNFPLNTR